jgi:hypothetical protein
MNQQIIDLYDRFTHGGMTRRAFLDRLTELAGSAAAGAAMLPLLQNNTALAAIVPDNDARLATERVSYDSPKGKINGYLVRAKAKNKRPAVIVIHENRGVHPTSKMWRDDLPSKASWLWRRTCCRSRAARPPTPTRRAIFSTAPTKATCWKQRSPPLPS